MSLTNEDYQRIKGQYEKLKAAKDAVYNNMESSVEQLQNASMIFDGNALGLLEFILSHECPPNSPPAE
jgi:hypothetical protein